MTVVRKAQERLAAHEPLAILLLAPILLVQNRASIVALIAVPALWLNRRCVSGRLTASSPMDVPIAVLTAMTVVSLFASSDLRYSLPKLNGIVLGVALYYAVVNANPGGRLLVWAALLFPAAGVAVGALGLVATDLWQGKLFRLGPWLEPVPWIRGLLPESALAPGQAGIHPNELGGTLTLLIPVAALLAASCRRPALRVAYAGSFVVMLAVLGLSQSRSAWIGAGAALVAGLLTRLGLTRWVAAVATGGATVGLAASVLVASSERVGQLFELLDHTAGGSGSGISRAEVWSRAWYVIQDFPLTGIGLNTFPFVLDALYPTFISPPEPPIVHAHNIYLQAGVDLGVPGAIAFVALLTAAAQTHRVARGASWPGGVLASGCALGLLGFGVYGLTDAITLGARPGLFFWLQLGVIALAARRASAEGACRSATTTAEASGGVGNQAQPAPRGAETAPLAAGEKLLVGGEKPPGLVFPAE